MISMVLQDICILVYFHIQKDRAIAETYYLLSMFGSFATGFVKVGLSSPTEFADFPRNLLTSASQNRPVSGEVYQFIRSIGSILGGLSLIFSVGGLEEGNGIGNSVILMHLIPDIIDLIPPHLFGDEVYIGSGRTRLQYSYSKQLVQVIPDLILGLIYGVFWVII